MSKSGQDDWFGENAFVPEGSSAPPQNIPIKKAPEEPPPPQKKHKLFGGLFKKKEKKTAEPTVGSPFNVHHHVHVDFNTKTGFVGLPPEWEAIWKTVL